jgi:hypothetical protein
MISSLRQLQRRCLIAAGVAGSLLVTSQVGVGGASASPSSNAPAPIATTLENSYGYWATLPMGHLSDPLNTFWQLLVRPRGSARWQDVTSFGVATNGGLVMTSPSETSLMVGTLPSNLLTFSTVASTSIGSKSWTSAPPPPALARSTNALTGNANGERLALVGKASSRKVLIETTGKSAWKLLATVKQLSEPAGHQCGLTSLTTVLLTNSGSLIGGACQRPGVIPLLSGDSSSWHLTAPRPPSALNTYTFTVLGTYSEPSAVLALMSASTRTATRLVIARRDAGQSHWSVTAGPMIVGSPTIESIGPSPDGVFVLYQKGYARHLVASNSTGTWTSLPEPPKGTATVSFGPSGEVQALVVNQSTLNVFTLEASKNWRKVQVMRVGIEYGSSG